jgi:hypothetical protein
VTVRTSRVLCLYGGIVALLVAAILIWWACRISGRPPVVGDGHDPATYGFDLGDNQVPGAALVASGRPRDGIQVLDHPRVLTRAEVEARRKYLVPGDLVLGVEVAGEARAYPLRIMQWHEIANDELGGVPIAVTYAPLADAAAVFDRRRDGRVLRFGHSGLLLNSTLLMYDRGRGGDPTSLWSQVLGRAVTGPAAGEELRRLPCAVVPWRQWLAGHPATTVLGGEPTYRKPYRRAPYSTYREREVLRFPISPRPDRPFEPLHVGDQASAEAALLHCYRFAWDSLQAR